MSVKKCYYSGKFEPLVKWKRAELDDDAFMIYLEENFEDAPNVFNLFARSGGSNAPASTDEGAQRLNQRQTKIVNEIPNDISGAYFGNSEGYTRMLKNFKREMIERSRIKVDFETGDVTDVNPDEIVEGYSLTTLNKNILEYKLKLINDLRSELKLAPIEVNFNMTDSELREQIFTVVNGAKNKNLTPEGFDAYIVLMKFDYLIQKEIPFIEIGKAYVKENLEGVSKYTYKGADVQHFTGWTKSEYADSMDQSSELIRMILDYIPEVDEHGKPIEGTSINLAGFLSSMTSLREALLYEPAGELLKVRDEIFKGNKMNMGKIIDSYINYLENYSSARSINDYYEKHITYLTSKLRSLKKYIFDENSAMDSTIRDIMKLMFFKNVQVAYRGYIVDPDTKDLSGKDLKGKLIDRQAYALMDSVASAIYKYRNNKTLFADFETKWNNGAEIKSINGVTTITKGEGYLKFKPSINGKRDLKVETNFTFEEMKELIFDLFDYIIPEDYIRIGSQINSKAWNPVDELGSLVRLGIMGIRGAGITFDNNFPVLNDYKNHFMQMGKTLSVICGSSTMNVIKSINGKSNYPLYSLTSLAYNFPFLTRKHSEPGSIYENHFLLDSVMKDPSGNEIFIPGLVGSPMTRSDIYINKQLKSPSKATVSELARISFLNDFLQNVLDPSQKYMYLQNATFADKNTHFLVSYALDRSVNGLGDNFRNIINQIMKTGNSKSLFDFTFKVRHDRIVKLVNNILEDYQTVFAEATNGLKSLEEIEIAINGAYAMFMQTNPGTKLKLQDYVRERFKQAGVNFYENVHLSNGEINPVIKLYNSLYNTPGQSGTLDTSKFEARLQEQRKRMVKDLLNNNFILNVNSDGSLVEKMGKAIQKGWVDEITGNVELAKVFRKNDKGQLERVVIDKYNMDETLLDPNLHIVLNPALEAYFMSDILLSNEYNELMIGGVYSHGKGAEAQRLIAQIKRSVIFGATIHPFAQGLANGVAENIKVAVIDDWKAAVQNIVGEEKLNQDSMDGAGISSPIQALLENNSLLDARVGWDKKTIMHDNDYRYGRPTLLKWAVYAMTNARRRMSAGSVISQEYLFKRMHNININGIRSISENEMNELLNSFSEDVYIKNPYAETYYKLEKFQGGNMVLIQVDKDGNYDETNPVRTTRAYSTNTLYEIDQAFGGAWSMKKDNDTLVYSEANNHLVVNLLTKYPQLKDCFIAYAVNSSAIKVGAGNVNNSDFWSDGDLSYITMSTAFGGVQMDAEHDLDETEVTEMTQMISALSESGYTSKQVEAIYEEIGRIIQNAIAKYDKSLGNTEEIYKILGEAFIKSFESNDRDTLGLAQAFVQKANRAFKAGNFNYKIPLSAKTVSGIYISTVSSLLTKKGIRRKYDGFAGVLTPSYNSIQYFLTGQNGKPQMYEDFIKSCKEQLKKIFNYDDDELNRRLTDMKEAERLMTSLMNDIYINNELNPFLEEVPIENLGKLTFEDTVVLINADGTYTDPIYINNFETYDTIKHQTDFTGKRIYIFKSRPRNLKGTDVTFQIKGHDYSMYDMDSVRASFYLRRGINLDFVNSVLAPYDENPAALDTKTKLKLLQEITQNTLRNLNLGRPISIGMYRNVVVDKVEVVPAQCITGRYHSKEFMMDVGDTMDDIIKKKELFFLEKLRTKYQFPQYQKGINDTEIMDYAFFSETGECFSVKVINEEEREKFLNESHKGYTISEDESVLKLEQNVYYKDEDITSSEGKHFYKITFDDGVVQKLIICDDQKYVGDLRRSTFFDYERKNYKTKAKRDEESKKFRKDITTKAKQMYRSFEIQQKMIGTRIPAQAMQSFMPMEIIGWTDSFVNEIYVPVMQMYLQGSDLDIDKAFNLGFEVQNGKVVVGSKLLGEHDFRYSELFELSAPNGKEYIQSFDATSVEVTADEVRSVLGTYEANPNRINVLNKIYNSGWNKIKFDETLSIDEKEMFLKFVNKHSTTRMSDRVRDAALKNKAVWHMYNNVILNPENQINANISIDSVMSEAGKAAERNEAANDDKFVNSDNPMTKFVMQVQNMVGKEVIGIVAVSLKQFFAKTAYYNKIVNDFHHRIRRFGPTESEAMEFLNEIIKYNPLSKQKTTIANLNLLTLLDAIEQDPNMDYTFKRPYEINGRQFTRLYDLLKYLQSEANRNDAALSLSALLSLATDNAKELKLSKLNATSNLVDIYTYLLSLGSSVDDVAQVMTSKLFNYAAKMSEGDVFSYYSRPIKIEKALGFLIGDDLPFNIDKDIVTYYFGLYDYNKGTEATMEELYALLKTPDGLKRVSELITAIENEIKEKRRSRIDEEGEEDDEGAEDEDFIDDEFDEYEDEKPQHANRNLVENPPTYKEKLQMIYLLQMILDRNNFLNHIEKPDFEAIQIIRDAVLPGVEEQQMMGFIAGINTGLKTDVYKKYRFRKRIENYINKVKTNRTDNKQKKFINAVDFSFYDFIREEDYDFWIEWMDKHCVNDNVLKIGTNVDHFYNMLQTWFVDETALQKTSVRYKLINYFADKIVPNSKSSLNELEFKEVVNYVDELLVANWLRQSGLRFKVPAGQSFYKPNRNLEKASEDRLLNFETSHDYATFKYLMETWIIPEMKKMEEFKDNDFIKALTMNHKNDKRENVVRQFYHLPIEMMDVNKSTVSENLYNAYLTAFTDISNMTFNGWKIGDLFYMYNLIVHKDSFGQKTMTRLFENIVGKDEDGDYLVNKYYNWLTRLDGLDIESVEARLLWETADIKYRIGKRVPDSKLKINKKIAARTHYLFDLPFFDDSPNRITDEKFITIDEATGTVPMTYYIKSILPSEWMHDNNVIFYNNADVKSVIDETATKESLMEDGFDEITAEYFMRNIHKIANAKAFIFNGRIYYNADKANAFTYLHEVAHVILAEMKWNKNPQIRDTYYQLVSQVVNHKLFNSISRLYPESYGSDLQEEVLVNIFEMYLNNEVLNGDEMFEMIQNLYNTGTTNQVESPTLFLNKMMEFLQGKTNTYENIDFTALVEQMASRDGSWEPQGNEFLINETQKVSSLKNRLIKDKLLELKCK